jgi:pimeloyl-ACP methyl ester carboxylesterase
MAVIQVDGRAVEYVQEGHGREVVVLCSPNFWPLDTWKLSGLPELRDSYRVIAFNSRGYGQSAGTPTEYTIYTLAEDTIRLMDALDVPRAHLVGFAYGAQVAVKIGLGWPERVSSLVLGAAGAGAPSNPNDLPIHGVQEAIRRKGYKDYIQGHVSAEDWAFHPEVRAAHPERPAALAEAMWEHAATEEEFLKHVRARGGHQTLDDIERITAPALVIVGDEDFAARGDSTPTEFAKVLAARLPNAELAIVPRTRHMLFWERPEICWPRVKQFLATHSSGA